MSDRTAKLTEAQKQARDYIITAAWEAVDCLVVEPSDYAVVEECKAALKALSRLPESRPTPGSEPDYMAMWMELQDWLAETSLDVDVIIVREQMRRIAAPASVGAGTPPQERDLLDELGRERTLFNEAHSKLAALQQQVAEVVNYIDANQYNDWDKLIVGVRNTLSRLAPIAAPVPPRGAEPQERWCSICRITYRGELCGGCLDPSGAAAPLGATEPPASEGLVARFAELLDWTIETWESQQAMPDHGSIQAAKHKAGALLAELAVALSRGERTPR